MIQRMMQHSQELRVTRGALLACLDSLRAQTWTTWMLFLSRRALFGLYPLTMLNSLCRDPSGDAKSTQLPEDIELNDSYPKDILRADSTKVKSTSGQNPFASDRQVPTQYFSARRVPRHGGGTSSELLGSLTPPIRSGLQVLNDHVAMLDSSAVSTYTWAG